MRKPIKVLFVGSEMWPYASVGGLSRVMYSLPKSLINIGVDARVFIPKFGKIDFVKYDLQNVCTGIKVKMSSTKEVMCNVLFHQLPEAPLTYFLENQEYFELRANEYGYSDDAIRWGLLQKGAWEFLKKYDDWTPDIVHGNDWPTGLLSNIFKEDFSHIPKLKNIKNVYTIHSLGYQGNYDHRFLEEDEKDDGLGKLPGLFSKKFEKLNSVRRAIINSDFITTVSPTYAKEILTHDFSEGLDSILIKNKKKLVGILNGLSYDEFNSNIDSRLRKNFKKGEWIKRSENKISVQERFKLKKDTNIPVFVISYRLCQQKGLDLVKDVIGTFIKDLDVQLIVNGDGDGEYKMFFQKLQQQYPDKVGTNLSYNDKLPRLLFSGGDFLIHPSKFEPCGIVQLEAMRYGCIPIVRNVGGLADTVEDGETGFVFNRFNSHSLLITLSRAYEVFKHKDIFHRMQSHCMEQDFSWVSSAEKYLSLYKRVIGS